MSVGPVKRNIKLKYPYQASTRAVVLHYLNGASHSKYPVFDSCSASHLQNDRRNNRQMVNMYKNKMTGEFKGEAMITYDDPQAAKAAIEWFNGMSTSDCV